MIKECGDLLEYSFGFRSRRIVQILSVRKTLEHLRWASTPASCTFLTVFDRNRSHIPQVKIAGEKRGSRRNELRIL